MSRTAPARTATRGTPWPVVVGLGLVTAAILGSLVVLSPLSISDVVRGDRGGPTTEAGGALTEDDGILPDGVTVFDDRYPGVSNLDPDLLRALRDAATDASDDDVEFVVNSGWRSPGYQDQLLREAVSEYGSEEEAARWVATADTSLHVSGDAVDIGPSDAAAWRPSTAPTTDCARSTATSPGTSNCAPGRSSTGAGTCTTTPRRIRGCSSDPGVVDPPPP